MQKNILILASLATTFIHGMETVSLHQATINSWSILYYTTKIHLTQESLFDVSDKVDITVVGKYQQKMLGDDETYAYDTIGITYFPDPPIIYQKKNNNSSSVNDTYNPYHPEKKNLPSDSKIIERNHLVKVVEPCIIQKYHTKKIGGKIIRTITKRKTISKNVTLKNNIPIFSEEKKHALARCYDNVLLSPRFTIIMSYAIKNYNKKRSIALPTLSVDFGFPRQEAASIAVTTIVNFIRNNQNMYDNIYFIIEKQSDFNIYKKLLLKPWKKIILFLCASQDKGSTLSILPPDIIWHIVAGDLSFNS